MSVGTASAKGRGQLTGAVGGPERASNGYSVSGLVDQLSDNPATKMTAQEIAERVQRARQRPASGGV